MIIDSYCYALDKAAVIDELKIIASRERKSKAALIMEIIEEYVLAHKEGNSQHLLTSFVENEDFVGFPSVALDLRAKREYVAKHLQTKGRINDLGSKLYGHIDEWQRELQKL